MKMHMGFWSPNHESQGVIDIRVEWARKWMVAMDLIEKTGRGTKRVIQAGGNVGIFPVGLSQHFDEVVTFEPGSLKYMNACSKILSHTKI